MNLLTLLVRDMAQTGAKLLLILDWVETSKVYDPNQGKWLSHGILTGLAWVFLTPLDVSSALLKYFFPPGSCLVQDKRVLQQP